MNFGVLSSTNRHHATSSIENIGASRLFSSRDGMRSMPASSVTVKPEFVFLVKPKSKSIIFKPRTLKDTVIDPKSQTCEI